MFGLGRHDYPAFPARARFAETCPESSFSSPTLSSESLRAQHPPCGLEHSDGLGDHYRFGSSPPGGLGLHLTASRSALSAVPLLSSKEE